MSQHILAHFFRISHMVLLANISTFFLCCQYDDDDAMQLPDDAGNFFEFPSKNLEFLRQNVTLEYLITVHMYG